RKVYMSLYNVGCNICKEVARLRIIEGRFNCTKRVLSSREFALTNY
ncbi:2749_t:CDS:2, partial [Dentiscutata erythropus]